MSARICEGRVCVVTGAGRGIGRAHARLLAASGASVVVNDLGGSVRGDSTSDNPAAVVVGEIERAGGRAVVSKHDVADWDQAQALVDLALSTFGRLDAVVNNAGILRDKMLVNMTEADWDSVLAVHAKGTFQVTRAAAAHWRERSRAGTPDDARVVNTTSASGLYGNPGQANYGAAKAAIASFTIIAAQELERYGVGVNAVAPAAMTRMTEGLPIAEDMGEGVLAPEWVSPVVAWLVSEQSRGVTGRVFEASGQGVSIAEGWSRGSLADPIAEVGEADTVLRSLLTRARPNADIYGAAPEVTR